jgi:hypothetical protein
MKTETIVLVFVVLVIVGSIIGAYQYYYDQQHGGDKPLLEFMNYIVVNHPACFDGRYTNLANWELESPNHYRTINSTGLSVAEMELMYNPNGPFGHLEANTTCGLFVWDGILWNSNNTVKELIYTITG